MIYPPSSSARSLEHCGKSQTPRGFNMICVLIYISLYGRASTEESPVQLGVHWEDEVDRFQGGVRLLYQRRSGSTDVVEV